MKHAAIAVFLLSASAAFADYSYFYSQDAPSGGTLNTMLLNGSYCQGEVRVVAPSSGLYGAVFAAGSDADVNQQLGSYYEVQVGGGAGITLYKVQQGQSTQLAQTYQPGAVLRVVNSMSQNGIILVYMDNVLVIQLNDPTLSCGMMGLYVVYGPVSHLDFGSFDGTPPDTIPASSIQASPYFNHVDLQWPTPTDSGIGVAFVKLYRNGTLLTTTTNTTFTDPNVSPSQNYSYTLSVVTYHGMTANTTFSVSTPRIPTNPPFPSITPDGMRTGVRSTVSVRPTQVNFGTQPSELG
jgi:hypothetical protein